MEAHAGEGEALFGPAGGRSNLTPDHTQRDSTLLGARTADGGWWVEGVACLSDLEAAAPPKV
eukprot:jgi/Tetstr1/444960/TSEL_032778.t1